MKTNKRFLVFLAVMATAAVAACVAGAAGLIGTALARGTSCCGIRDVAGSSYMAVCEDKSMTGHKSDWLGPVRKTRTEAEADAKAHRSRYPGHNPWILY